MSDEIPARPAPVSHGPGPLGKLGRLVSTFYGDAERDRVTEPVRHLHDEFEDEIDDQIGSIRVETDGWGRHYGVRIVPPPEPQPEGYLLSYPSYAKRSPVPPGTLQVNRPEPDLFGPAG
ncbi:hypothetical protein ACIQXM_06950 [Arthrobacter sp. NPDC097144]|uniref:hypothetical protein n=1 Tax=Arthrobacter sp. NPDC097144 TaxID=3363946 RepID=UPI003820BA0C